MKPSHDKTIAIYQETTTAAIEAASAANTLSIETMTKASKVKPEEVMSKMPEIFQSHLAKSMELMQTAMKTQQDIFAKAAN